MKTGMFLITCVCVTLACPMATAQATSSALGPSTATRSRPMQSRPDRVFLRKASATNLAEVQFGRLAVSQGTNSAVKAFARHMIADHTAAGEDLQTIAHEQSSVLATAPSSAQQQAYGTLKGLFGDTFDHAYAKQAVLDQRAAIRLFTSEEQQGMNPGLRHYAAQTLPVLKAHLALAMKLPQG